MIFLAKVLLFLSISLCFGWLCFSCFLCRPELWYRVTLSTQRWRRRGCATVWYRLFRRLWSTLCWHYNLWFPNFQHTNKFPQGKWSSYLRIVRRIFQAKCPVCLISFASRTPAASWNWWLAPLLKTSWIRFNVIKKAKVLFPKVSCSKPNLATRVTI